jgi:hypothetical protein
VSRRGCPKPPQENGMSPWARRRAEAEADALETPSPGRSARVESTAEPKPKTGLPEAAGGIERGCPYRMETGVATPAGGGIRRD